jgi:UDP-glucose 4-epimerase
VTVDEIASVVAEEMQVKPEKHYSGGRHGWTGDVPLMLLSIEKLRCIGWKPSMDSKQAVQKTAKEILGK